ncbi:MAG TPA: hypothetical protein PK014_05025 [Thermoanaerobaculia bacterium]|nr:hypothetical protein [Thermoanaerobaculia bacterium]HUM29487.1 hypothetical protein [Thermoanaerobaculia bacterium]HXK67870.1 hypothetical protein [Thermoanaerobaculia bacterium]
MSGEQSPSSQGKIHPGDQEGSGLFHVTISCPKCGGETTWHLLQTLATCPYCSSGLWWPDSGEILRLVALDQARDPEHLLDILMTHDAIRTRADMVPQNQSSDPGSEALLMGEMLYEFLPDLDSIKRQRRHLFEIHEVITIHAPYFLYSLLLAFHALGRKRPAAKKVFETHFFQMDDMVPCYDSSWNFRDRGLWMSRQTLTTLTPEAVAAGWFLESREQEILPEDAARHWLQKRLLLEPDMDPLTFLSSVHEPRSWIVYRPYHFVRARMPAGTDWVLIDGQFQNIAGFPTSNDLDLLHRNYAPRLAPSDFRSGSLRLIPYRCPVCGWDIHMNPRGHHQICTQCGRMLTPSDRGLTEIPYFTIPPLEIPWRPAGTRITTGWAPFWRMRIQWSDGDKDFSSLRDLFLSLVPSLASLRNFSVPDTDRIFLPAFDVRVFDGFHEWAMDVSSYLTERDPEVTEDRPFMVYTAREDDIVLPDMDVEKWNPFLGKILFDLMPEPVRMRMNAGILRRLGNIEGRIKETDLVYVPLPVADVGANPMQIIGPSTNQDWLPLKTGSFAPGVHRTVRRWKDRAASLH